MEIDGRLEAVEIRDGDTLVVSCDRVLSQIARDFLSDDLRAAFPGVGAVVFLDGGLRLRVARSEDEAPQVAE